MIVFLTALYLLLLFVLIKAGKLPNKSTTWLTVIPYDLVLLLFFFIPMQWGSPAGDVHVLSYSVSITPNVAGQVIEVPVKPNTPLKKGDVLFKIDPTQYQATYDALKADLDLALIRLQQAKQLAKKQAGSITEVERRQANVAKIEAQLRNAKWNLDQTVVRAPSDGYVTNVALRPGQRVGNLPANQNMAFIDTSEVILAAQVLQNFSRYIEPGQEAEVTFKSRPGKVYPAKVMYVLPATAQGQLTRSGRAVAPRSNAPAPFVVRLQMDDPEITKGMVVGSVGSSAIYTGHAKAAQVIRKVMLRMTAIMNYINPT